MIALGYHEKTAKSMFAVSLRKLARVNSMFEDSEYRKATHIITMKEAYQLLSEIEASKSKYRERAEELIITGLDDSILTTDDCYTPEQPKKVVIKPKKSDLEAYLENRGLEEDFNDWFKANRIGA